MRRKEQQEELFTEDGQVQEMPYADNPDLARHIAFLEDDLRKVESTTKQTTIVFLAGTLSFIAFISAFIEALGVEFGTVKFLNFASIVVLAVIGIAMLCLAIYNVVYIAQINSEKTKIKAKIQEAKDSR